MKKFQIESETKFYISDINEGMDSIPYKTDTHKEIIQSPNQITAIRTFARNFLHCDVSDIGVISFFYYVDADGYQVKRDSGIMRAFKKGQITLSIAYTNLTISNS